MFARKISFINSINLLLLFGRLLHWWWYILRIQLIVWYYQSFFGQSVRFCSMHRIFSIAGACHGYSNVNNVAYKIKSSTYLSSRKSRWEDYRSPNTKVLSWTLLFAFCRSDYITDVLYLLTIYIYSSFIFWYDAPFIEIIVLFVYDICTFATYLSFHLVPSQTSTQKRSSYNFPHGVTKRMILF